MVLTLLGYVPGLVHAVSLLRPGLSTRALETRTVSVERGRGVAAVGAAMSVLLAACAGDSPEQRLQQAAEKLDDARVEARDARSALGSELAESATAQRDVDEARRELDRKRNKIADASNKLQARATDVAVFRTLQQELLDSEELRSAAVSAQVSDGRVELRGTVPDEESRQRAIAIARSTARIQEVTSHLVIAPKPQVEDEFEASSSGRPGSERSDGEAGHDGAS